MLGKERLLHYLRHAIRLGGTSDISVIVIFVNNNNIVNVFEIFEKSK